jgi:small conductance mechanosensitive channel
MRLIAALLAALFLLTAPVVAQFGPVGETETATDQADTQAGLDELIRLLEDDTTRAELIDLLRQRAETGTLAQPEEPTVFDPTIARQVAEYTRGVAESISATGSVVVDLATDIGDFFTGTADTDVERLGEVLTNLVILGVTLFVAFFLLRMAANRAQTAISARIAGGRWFKRAGGVLAAAMADLVAVVLAWAIGYFVALNFLADPFGRMGINQTLLLNAFLVVETVRVLLRVVFEPREATLRFLPMSDMTAAYWYFWFGRLISLVGYTFLFLAPILAENITAGAAQALRVLVMVTAVVILIASLA